MANWIKIIESKDKNGVFLFRADLIVNKPHAFCHAMFHHRINDQIELRTIEHEHSDELLRLLDLNREYLRRWYPPVDRFRSEADVEKAIAFWQLLHAKNRQCYAGIWCDGTLCGMINHVTVDWANHWATLSYWLAEAYQGRGIITSSCRAMISYGFRECKFNRFSIECATENTRSRAIPERLGFELEGIIRGIEWISDHHVDHAMYGMLRSDWTDHRAE